MTPKEKAVELRDKFYQASLLTIAGTATIFHQNAKRLAILAVEEVIPSARVIDSFQKPFIKTGDTIWVEYWNEVKQEINNL